MRRRLAVWASIAALALGGCTFERRAGVDGGAGADTTVSSIPSDPGAALEDSVRAVLSAFREALRLGDVTRVAQLSTPDAVLMDQEENILWSRAGDGGALLPAPLDGRRQGLGWVLGDSSFDAFGPSALLVNRYSATVSAEDVPWSAVETYLFVRTADGWRLHHLHRSRGLSTPPP